MKRITLLCETSLEEEVVLVVAARCRVCNLLWRTVGIVLGREDGVG